MHVFPPERKSDTWLVQLHRESSASVLQLLVEYPKEETESEAKYLARRLIGRGWTVTHTVPVKRKEGYEWRERRDRYVPE